MFYGLLTLMIIWTRRSCALKNNIFPEAIAQRDFIDKTEMLRIFFDKNYTDISDHPYYFVTVPRRFAKSINIDMVHTFTAAQFDSDGNPVNPRDTQAHTIFSDFAISKYTSIIDKHLARYVVVQLDLLAVAYVEATIDEAVGDLNSILWLELQNYPKLKNDSKLDEKDVEFLSKLENKALALYDLETSLLNLVRILYNYRNGTRIVLLIDEYDETAFKSYVTQNCYVSGVFKLINEMLTYALTYGKSYLELLLVHGVTTLTYSLDESLRAVLKHYPFLGVHPFTPFYGHTEQDMESLFVRYNMSEAEKTAVQGHYKGYVSSNRRIVLYNPHSIANYLHFRKEDQQSGVFNATSYVKDGDWLGRVAMFMKNKEFLAKMQDLRKNGSMQYAVSKRHVSDALFQLEVLRGRNFNGSLPHHVSTFMTQCFEMGYLAHGPEEGTYVIPNVEMREVFEDEFQKFEQIDDRWIE